MDLPARGAGASVWPCTAGMEIPPADDTQSPGHQKVYAIITMSVFRNCAYLGFIRDIVPEWREEGIPTLLDVGHCSSLTVTVE